MALTPVLSVQVVTDNMAEGFAFPAQQRELKSANPIP
jgi:hypothetical protein